MRYSCNDIFMVRTPSLPASVFSDFVQFEGNDVENFLQQTPFRDFMDKSILLSSRELYNAKKRNLQSSTKKSKARNLARIKFLIRACTRPTPYGLFAGAALGEFCENPNIEPMVIDERKAILECRADYSWLSHFIYEMENNPSVYPQLQLRFNNNCYVSGDRLKNPHHSNHGFLMPEETVTERTHMRNTPLITYVKQQAQTFIRYDLLKSRIQSKYPGVPEEKIISTINALMENEVLLSNLRAPANCENGLEYVLKILAPIEGIDRQKETLQKINTLINQMNGELEIDQVNAKTIESVYTLMDGLLSQKNEKDLLAVNKGMVLQQNKLPYQVKEIVEQFVEALTYLQVDVPSRLEKFKRQFQEEYGSNVEVPFCTIIDQNDFNGLSYLEKYQPSQDEKDQKIKQIVDEKILDCLQAQQEEINLSIDNFSSLEISREDRYPESFDINFFVSKEKEHYRLWLAPIGGSGAAGDMFNRFNCVLDADLFHQYKENNRSLVCSDKALITVEIREGSVKGRMSNVNNHRNESQYYIALATKEEKHILKACIEYLVALTRDTKFEGKSIIKFHVLQPNQNPNFNQEKFKRGNINFGLAHGMLGPLIALAKAHAKGFNIEGLKDGIEKVYHLYEVFQVVNEEKIPCWPGPMTVEEYWNGTCNPENLHISSSWCYGNAGVMRGLQKVAGYMGWKEKEQAHVETMIRFFSQNIKTYDLYSPSLCHGFSSLVAIQMCAYSSYRNPKLLTNLERHIQKMIAGYRKNNENELNLTDIRNKSILIEGHLKDLSILTGSVGIAITLLSLKRKTKTGKLLMID